MVASETTLVTTSYDPIHRVLMRVVVQQLYTGLGRGKNLMNAAAGCVELEAVKVFT